jgi:EAL domain-containing protein (putative c-di-GMP-specific phosphodiesterase class I)
VEALKLDGIDVATIRVFRANGDGVIVGLAGEAADVPYAVGTVLDPGRTAQLVRKAADGPWTETFSPSDDRAIDALYRAGLRVMANAPLVWNDHIVGVIGLGAGSGRSLAIDAERLITVREFGVVAGPLLGPPLAERARLDGLHEAVSQVIDRLAFHPVFQPIVDLSSGRTVGYEALTRFDDGVRPDVCFANAAAAGLGAALESACLRAAQRDAIALPAGAWLSLNVSPALAAAMVPLIAILEHGERDIVIEITEHAPISDYAGLTAALGGIRRHIRIAVDDAGAGYAGLKHILEIRPDIVKLDIALVRGVDGDPVRRALIAGMGAFARESGCVLLAEGIETPEELATLRALGVPLGQGYLLGRPAAIDDIVAANQLGAGVAGRPSRRRSKGSASSRAA